MARILVIDDDEQLRFFICQVLEGAGHQVETADDGAKGTEAFCRQPADLVLCDIFMPEKEGLETVLDLRRHFPDVKIISMSGGSAAVPGDFLPDARIFGAARILYKPFDTRQLLQVVADVLTGGDRGGSSC